MKRVLNFDPANGRSAKRFEMCLTAILQAGDQKGQRDRETIRKEARLLDAFDAISEPIQKDGEKPIGGPVERQLLPTGGTVTLSQDDHTLLTKYLDTTPWLPRAARDAVDVQDFADQAEKVD